MSGPRLPRECIPALLRRYLATLIDALVILLVGFIVAVMLREEGEATATLVVRLLLVLLIAFVYEPACTSRAATVGQYLAGVRVRRIRDGERIGILRAGVRLVVKCLLGWLSFITLPFTRGRRAMHDLATRTVVIRAGSESALRRWSLERRGDLQLSRS